MQERTTSEGLSTINWYNQDNPYTQHGYGLPNCTTYTWGRISEISGHAMPYSSGHAISYANKTFLDKIETPTFGAIAVWGGTYYGHVGVVEHVYDDGTILISESNYCGQLFHTALLSPSNNYSNGGMYLVGFYMYDGVTQAIEAEQARIKEEQRVKKYQTQKMIEQQLVDIGYKPQTTNLLPSMVGTSDSFVLAGTIGIQCYKNIIKNTKIVDMVNNICYSICELGKHHTFRWA